jgi:serine/threonine protein phosphatase PrpC
VVDPATIGETLGSKVTLEEKCQRLVEAAKANGAPDNITAILLECK